MTKFSSIALSVASIATIAVVGVAASATAGPAFIAPSSSPATETPSSNAITADIVVSVGFVGATQPTVYKVTGVTVGAGPELTEEDTFENPLEQCRDIAVDVSLNPTTITVTGGDGTCSFGEVHVEVTLHGVEFTTTELISDNLFSQFGDLELARSLVGGSYMSRGVHFGATDPFPVRDSFGVSGNTFSAHWSGENPTLMNGAAVFRWAPLALAAPAAPAAVAAAAAPAFTG